MTDELVALLAPRVARLGYLGAFFAVSARQPEALAGFIRFTESLKHALPDDLVEVVAIRVATALDNAYERSQHEALARARGMSASWIAALTEHRHMDGALDNDQRLVCNLTDAVLEHAGHGTADVVDAAVDRFGPARTVALVLMISRFVAHAHAANTFALINPLGADRSDPPQSSPKKEIP